MALELKNIFNFENKTFRVKQRENVCAGPKIFFEEYIYIKRHDVGP